MSTGATEPAASRAADVAAAPNADTGTAVLPDGASAAPVQVVIHNDVLSPMKNYAAGTPRGREALRLKASQVVDQEPTPTGNAPVAVGGVSEEPDLLHPVREPHVPPPAGPGKSVPITAYNSPKDTLLAVIKAGMAKSILPSFHIFLLAFNSGLFLSMGNLAGLAIAGGLSGPTVTKDAAGAVISTVAANAVYSKIAYALIFPVGLILIVLAGAELFTGNVMYLLSAWVGGKCRGVDVARNWTLAWLGNLAGSAMLAYFLCYLPEMLHSDPQLSYIRSTALKKMSTGWGSIFLKGVGCNWLVCLALWCNLTAQDTVSKIVALWVPITTFVLIGWEHSIANMFTLPIALMEGVSGHHFGDALAWNLIPVTLGNIVGGALFAMGQYFIYGEHAAPKVAVLTVKAHPVDKRAWNNVCIPVPRKRV